MCLKGETAICGTRLLSVSRQVGAHLWHEGPAGGLQWDSNPQPLNTSVSRGAGSTTELSSTLSTFLEHTISAWIRTQRTSQTIGFIFSYSVLEMDSIHKH